MRGTPSERQGKDWGRRQEEGGKMYRKRRQCKSMKWVPLWEAGKRMGQKTREGRKIRRRKKVVVDEMGTQKREVEERMGQNDKREEGKLRTGRRQCNALGGDPCGRQGKEWNNTKGRREN